MNEKNYSSLESAIRKVYNNTKIDTSYLSLESTIRNVNKKKEAAPENKQSSATPSPKDSQALKVDQKETKTSDNSDNSGDAPIKLDKKTPVDLEPELNAVNGEKQKKKQSQVYEDEGDGVGEPEILGELSKQKLISYVKKAGRDNEMTARKSATRPDGAISKDELYRFAKRDGGISRALDKIGGIPNTEKRSRRKKVSEGVQINPDIEKLANHEHSRSWWGKHKKNKQLLSEPKDEKETKNEALGTNYARNPSLKQINDFEEKVARHHIRKGDNRETYLKQFKPEVHKRMGDLYDRVHKKLNEAWYVKDKKGKKTVYKGQREAMLASRDIEGSSWGADHGYQGSKASHILNGSGKVKKKFNNESADYHSRDQRLAQEMVSLRNRHRQELANADPAARIKLRIKHAAEIHALKDKLVLKNIKKNVVGEGYLRISTGGGGVFNRFGDVNRNSRFLGSKRKTIKKPGSEEPADDTYSNSQKPSPADKKARLGEDIKVNIKSPEDAKDTMNWEKSKTGIGYEKTKFSKDEKKAIKDRFKNHEKFKKDLIDKGRPAIRHIKTGKIVQGKRGETHEQIAARTDTPEGKHWERGFYHPKYQRYLRDKDVRDVDSTNMMTGRQIDNIDINSAYKWNLSRDKRNDESFSMGEETLNEKFGVFRSGGSIGEAGRNKEPVKVHDDIESAKDHAKRMNKLISKGEKKYYMMKYSVKKLKEENSMMNEGTAIDAYTPNRSDKSFKGDRYERHSNSSGKTEWHSIIKTHQGGKSLKNEYGGHPCLHTGSPKYIDHKWKSLKSTYDNPRLTQGGIGESEQREETTLSRIKSILEARHSQGGGVKGKAGAKGQDTEGDDHPIMQLRSIKDLRGGKMTFADKSKHDISHDDAGKALHIYGGAVKPHEKEAITRQLGASHQSFRDALSGKPAPAAPKKGITLPGGVRINK